MKRLCRAETRSQVVLESYIFLNRALNIKSLISLCPSRNDRFWFRTRIRRSLQAKTEGPSVSATDSVAVTAIAGIAGRFRGLQKSENAVLGQKMPFMDGH